MKKLKEIWTKLKERKRKYIYLFDIILFSILLLEIFCLIYNKKEEKEKELDTWLGWYSFDSKYVDNGKSFFDTNDILIFKIDGNYYAEIICKKVSDPARLLGYVIGNEDTINIYFKSALPGDRSYEEDRYEDGELLVTLLYEDSELYTSWHALRQEYSIILGKGLYYGKVRQYSEDGKLPYAP